MPADDDREAGRKTRFRKEKTKSAFMQPEPTLCVIGLLRPVAGPAKDHIAVEGTELLLGRKPEPSGDCSVAILLDEGVSRDHAKITREHDNFVLRDLNSRNGTYVDGVPIVSCVLRDGDAIQIGRNLFYFDRLYELVDKSEGSSR